MWDKQPPNISRILLETGCVVVKSRPTFRWASGLVSPIYIDNRLLLSDPKGRGAVVDCFIRLIRQKGIRCDVVGGVATAGIAWGALVADRLKKPFIYVRPRPKEHGKGRQVEGRLSRGAKVLLVEDLVSTGGSSLNAVEAIRKEGGKVENLLALFSYRPDVAKRLFSDNRCAADFLATTEGLLLEGARLREISPRQALVVRRFLECHI